MDRFKLKECLIITYNQEDKFVIKDKIIKAIPVWKWLLKENPKYYLNKYERRPYR